MSPELTGEGIRAEKYPGLIVFEGALVISSRKHGICIALHATLSYLIARK